MTIKTKPEEIWQEYQAGREYNNGIGLYDTVRKNERFYVGDQWQGVNAPDLPKPTLNFLKRVVAYFIAMLISDDISVSFSPIGDFDDTACRLMSKEIDRVMERTKQRAKNRDLMRDAAVDGDCCLYLYYDPDEETNDDVKGAICTEIVDNINVYFGNPYLNDAQRQPYILICQRRMVNEVQEEAKKNGEEWESIAPDSDDVQGENDVSNSLCTVLVKLWKDSKTGTVHCCKTTEKTVVRSKFDTDLRMYPIAYMSWDKKKASYHGQSVITGLIPNQICVNKLYAMAIRSVEMSAFPKTIYDATKIKSWTNRVGEAIAVIGDPTNAVATSFKAQDMSYQVSDIIDRLISHTRDFMGASDAALGNVRPDNTSAIIAVQQASAVPLELQKLAFYQFVEDYVRVMVDIMSANYGTRERELEIPDPETGGYVTTEGYFDFSSLRNVNLEMQVDVGAAAYWSELMQVQTLDNLFAAGIISDPELYVTIIPDKYINRKQDLLDGIRQQKLQAQQAAAMQGMPAESGVTPMPNMLTGEVNNTPSETII